MAVFENLEESDWAIPSAYLWHSQALIDSRNETLFREARMLELLGKHTKCEITAKAILSQTMLSRIGELGYGDAVASWDLLDCFEALVSAQFHSKTTFTGACLIGKKSADQMAEYIEYDSDSFFLKKGLRCEYENWLQCHLDPLDAKSVSSTWGDLIFRLCQTVF